MAPRLNFAIFVAALVLTLGIRQSPVAHAAAPVQCLPAVRVTASVADEGKTAYQSLHDGNISTFLNSSAKGWQYVQFDFGCDVDLYDVRRYMTRDGRRVDGIRATLGEAILYSRDGVSWFEVTNDTSTGWETAKVVEPADGTQAGYRGFAWHSLPYGWSPRLSMKKPARARFVRYSWQILGDRFNELEVRYDRASATVPSIWNLPTWDWTQGSMITVNYKGDARRPPNQPVHLPWNDAGSECYDENPDIAPSNGWVIVSGKLGSIPLPNKPLPDYPYFVLYNKYRGILRSYVFYGTRVEIPHQATHQMGVLGIEGASVAAFTHHTGKYLFNYDPQYEQIFVKKNLYLDHWACLEFDASGYDQDIDDASKSGAHFRIEFHGLTETQLNAVGGITGMLDFSDVRTGRTPSGLDAITTGAGTFLKAVNIYKDVDRTLMEMAAKGSANAMTWWGPLVSQVAAVASQSAVPFISAAAGFITSLIDGGGTGNVPLSYHATMTGEFRLTGTLRTDPALSLERFYVPGSVYGPNPELLPLYHEPLGVYSLTREPVIEWYGAPNGRMAQQWGGTHGVTLSFDPASVSVNPRSGLRLHSIAVAPVSASFSQPIPFKDPGAYTGVPEEWMTQTQMNSLKVGVRLQFARVDDPAAPLITFYREYPAVFQNSGVWGDL